MQVPFSDLKAHYMAHRDEYNAALMHVVDKAAFTGGPFVHQFEEAFSAFCKTKHAVGVANGTSAFRIALKAMDIKAGDEVILAPNTFVSAAEAVSNIGATPVFVDVDEQTYTMNPAALETAITRRTKAVIPSHLFGQPAEMHAILQVARKRKLFVIEDASHAHGALYKGQRVGSIGDVACFGFEPDKNLGAFGDAGALVTNNSELAARMRMLRDHGQSKKYHHRLIGCHAAMNGFQGAILSVKLKYVEQWNELRRRHAHQYDNLLMTLQDVITPYVAPTGIPVYHRYVVRIQQRDAVLARMQKRGVRCGIHYPVPLHLQEAFEHLGYKSGAFPVAEKCCNEFVSLPMFPELTPSQLLHVLATLKAAKAEIEKSAPIPRGNHQDQGSGYKKTTIVS